MKKILLVESSPRKDRSITTAVSRKLIAKLKLSQSYQVDVIDLWNTDLPHMNGTNLAAKYAIFEGKELTPNQQQHWDDINAHVQRFASADIVIIAAPTWNWGIPYVLKHYVDVITQPGLTFSWSLDSGYTSMLSPRLAFLVTSSGGDYTEGSGNEQDDFSIKYLQLWLSSCMGCEVDMINVTLTAAGDEAIKNAYRNADLKIDNICASSTLAEAKRV